MREIKRPITIKGDGTYQGTTVHDAEGKPLLCRGVLLEMKDGKSKCAVDLVSAELDLTSDNVEVNEPAVRDSLPVRYLRDEAKTALAVLEHLERENILGETAVWGPDDVSAQPRRAVDWVRTVATRLRGAIEALEAV